MSKVQVPSTLHKVTVYWDIENCPVPSGFEGYEVVVALRNLALRYGFLHRIVAIANLDQLSKGQRNALQDSGVSMHDVSSRKPSAADMAIFVEILKLVMDVPPPHVIVMITGDRDFSKLLHVLVGRGYHVVLLHTSEACPVLQSTATEHHHWHEFVKKSCTYRSPAVPQDYPIPSPQTTTKPETSPVEPVQQQQPLYTVPNRRPTLQQQQLPWNNNKTTSISPVKPPAPTFGPLVDYLTLEAQQGRHVVKLCDLGVQKEIPWRKYYLKLKSYIEAAARLGFVTMIYLPNNQIGVCLTDKCHFTLIRKIQKLVQDLPYILEQMKIQFLAPVEQNLQNVVKSRFGFRASPHHWEIFLQCLQCCGYQIAGPSGKRTIIGLLGNFDGFDPSEPKHTLQGDALREFEEFLAGSRTDNEGGFAWNSNSGRFGFVTDLLQVGPPLIRATPSGVLLSHIQIMLNKRTLGYNKDNKICRSECIDQPANVSIDINSFRQKLENALNPHSTLLHPLIELQVAAPLVRDLWKCLGFSKMKHCLKFAEEHAILLCDWKMREDSAQPWIALTSSMRPIVSVTRAYFEHIKADQVDANIIKARLEKKFGYIRASAWKDILTVAAKHPLLNLKQIGTNYLFFQKKELENPEDISSNVSETSISPAEAQSHDEILNHEESLNRESDVILQPTQSQEGPTEYDQYTGLSRSTFEDASILHQPYDYESFQNEIQSLQTQLRDNLHLYEPLKTETSRSSYDPVGFHAENFQHHTVGSSLQRASSSQYLLDSNSESMFHTSPFEVIDHSDERDIDSEDDENEDETSRNIDEDSYFGHNRAIIGEHNDPFVNENYEKCIVQ